MGYSIRGKTGAWQVKLCDPSKHVPFLGALEMVYDDVLYKLTFTYLLWYSVYDVGCCW